MGAPLLTLECLRQVEREALRSTAPGELMARAGRRVGQRAARIVWDLPRGLPIEVLVGSGNNGGDALVAAMHLLERGHAVVVRGDATREPLAADALAVHRQWRARGGGFEPLSGLADALARAPSAPLVIDGLFGIGLTRPISGEAAKAIAVLGQSDAPVLAVDIPSGLDADRGVVVGGAAGVAVRATHTCTFIADKPGLRTADGPRLSGTIECDGLGVAVGSDVPQGVLIDTDHIRRTTRRRAPTGHKGTFGSVLVIGGAPGMHGAALLAGLSAQSTGVGKTFVASAAGATFGAAYPQLMTRAFDAPIGKDEVLVIGCGLGQDARARAKLDEALASEVPCVIDADALNLLASDETRRARLRARRAPAVLTPHPLEAARLAGQPVAQIQADRVTHALALAAALGATIVLKGPGTVVAGPDGRWAINASGSVALATGGTGDVLAGVVGSLLAQDFDPWAAACVGVWLHGRAGDLWHREHPQGAGLSAVRLAERIPEAWPDGISER